VAAGTVVTSVAGIVRGLGAPSPQSANGKSYELVSWSDGGAASHEITTPGADTTYTASFRELAPGGAPTGGLLAEYFDNLDFSGTRIARTDPTIDFDWALGSPDPRLGSDTFSARWTGKVTPAFSETHTFYTVADDGVRLWVNGQLVIDAWYDQGANEHSGTINLNGGQSYDLKLEYYENRGFASAQLLWSSARTAKAIVPSARLGGGGDPPPPPPPPGFPIKINFQLAGVAVPTGYLPDTGALFGPRSGASYGWNKDHTDVTRDRDLEVDQRLDTLCHFHAGGVWEIARPNGSYNVLVSIGDPQHESTHTLNIEGQAYWSNRPLSPGQFLSATKSITVSDGRLTVDQGPAAEKATRINYLEISR
jgi:hypothetical protein